MLTKSKSLYFTVPFRVFLALFFSVLLFIILAFLADFIILKIWGTNVSEQKPQIDKLVAEIQLRITENSITFSEAKQIESLWSNTGYTLHFLSSVEDYSSEQSQSVINDTYFIYELDFFDAEGSVLVISNTIRYIYSAYFILSGLASLILFLVLILMQMSNVINKIKTIEKGINTIANVDLTHKIAVKGEKELISLAENINNMGQTLYNKNQKERKEEQSTRALITNLSHDVRTPLTSITGYIELIKTQSEQGSEIYSFADIAQKNSARLKKLIDDLFFYSKLISKDIKPTPSEFKVNLVLSQIIELRQSDIKTNFQYENITIYADINNFQRILANLLDNAEKYKSKNSPIFIETYCKMDALIISIKNQTDENLSEKINLLTKRMYKAQEDRADGSSGLGLSIVKELVKSCGGELLLSFEEQIFTAKVIIPFVTTNYN